MRLKGGLTRVLTCRFPPVSPFFLLTLLESNKFISFFFPRRRLFIRGRQALTPDGDDDGGGGAGGGVLTLNHNDENQESLHYARGCYRTLKNYLRDVHTTLEYNAHDHLANIDNPLLLNIQAYTADQRLNPFKAGFNPRSCLNPPHKGHHRRRYPA